MNVDVLILLALTMGGVMLCVAGLGLAGLITGRLPRLSAWKLIGMMAVSMLVVAYGMAPPAEPPVRNLHVDYGEPGASIGDAWSSDSP